MRTGLRCIQLFVYSGGLAGAVACASERGTPDRAAPGGVLVIAAPAEPQHLLPPLVPSLAERQVVDQIFDFLADVPEGLATVGDAGYRPRLADRWSWSPDSASVTFTLIAGATFHDGRPVTAEDVRFTHALYTDPAVASMHAQALPLVDSVVVLDSSTVRFHFGTRNPERFFQLVYNLPVLPQHAFQGADRSQLATSSFASAPVGSGPFRFGRWERGTHLELTANETYFRGRPTLDRVIWRFGGDFATAARSVIAGESDFVETLRPEAMQQITPEANVRAVEYPSWEHGMLLFNTRSQSNRRQPHPILGDPNVRRALAMAIDRAAVVRNAYDSLAVVSYGPFTRAQWSADTTIAQLAMGVDSARRLLEAAGWTDGNNDGVREHAGQRLQLTLLVPSVSTARQRMAVVLQEQLRGVGAQIEIESAEPAALGPRLGGGKFDAFLHAWHLDPSPASIAQSWGGRDLERSFNFGWYSSAAVDSLIDAARNEPDATRAKALYRSIYERIVQDAPAVFLWEPRNFALVHKRFRFGALRGDAWWSGLATWSIPSAERLERDRVP